MEIVGIVASCAGIIAINGGLPADCPEDMKWFREKTMGEVLVMGRKTVDSLPKKLDGRIVVCLTRDSEYQSSKADVILKTKNQVFQWAEEMGLKRLFIAGGEQIYNLFSEDMTNAYVTRIGASRSKLLKANGNTVTLTPTQFINPVVSSIESWQTLAKDVKVEYLKFCKGEF